MSTPVKELLSHYIRIAERQPDAPAFTCNDTTLSFAALIERSLALADDWKSRADLKAGTRVLVLENDPVNIITAVFAGWSFGASVALLRPTLPADQLSDLTGRLNPSFITGLASAVEQAKKSVPERDKICASPEECLVVLTSGSTAQPKAVAVPASGLGQGVAAIALSYQLTPKDKVQIATPLTYALGILSGALLVLYAGAHVVAHPPSTLPTTLHRAVWDEGITIIQGPSSLHELSRRYWSGQPFTSVRIVHQGGEPMAASLGNWLEDAYPNARFIRAFAMTEGITRITHVDMPKPGEAGNLQGKPFDFWDIGFNDPDMDQLEGVGILTLKGPTLMLGYINQKGAYEGLDADGRFVTNDLISQDEDGNLYYHGRADRCFKTGGQTVNPTMVELALRRHPEVRHAICGSKPHPVLGNIPIATITTDKSSDLSAADIKAFCKTELEQYMVPQEVTITHEAELAPSGKMATRPS